MPDDNASKPREPTVQVSLSLYRSLILGRLRAEIAAKRAEMKLAKIDATDLAQRVDPNALGGMAYWKMGYWKMRYWKHLAVVPGDTHINPPLGGKRRRSGKGPRK